MTIDTSGKWWKGSEFADIEAYLRALEPGGYPVHKVIQARCTCGSTVFHLEVDQEEELAQTICAACKRAEFVADTEEYLSEAAKPRRLTCPGRHDQYEVGLGLCIREGQWVRWMSIGLRCTSCGILSSPLDWKSDLDLTDPASTRIG
jgi:hypothetical protein